MLDANHKTVFVLDHGPSMEESSKQLIDFDIFTKSRPQGFIPLAPISKSLWTCCVEALSEYCRIVWDIFPGSKFLRFVVSDNESRVLNTWSQNEQSISHLHERLASVGPPIHQPESSVIPGIVSAVQALTELTEAQEEKASQIEDDSVKLPNRGRIICITQLKHDVQRRTIEDCVVDAVGKHNERASKTNSSFLPLAGVELVIIHVKPFGVDLHVSEKTTTALERNNIIISELHNVKATRHGIAIANRLLNLVQKHYDLSVTSVSGIPMKEEQHANSSANYDVLLLHPRLPGMTLSQNLPSVQLTDSELSSTMMLKWYSPKTNSNELYHCDAAVRISPVDVNSRPSLCLTNFLLNGRSVLLEKWENNAAVSSNGSRQTTHMICCHGNDIFLHALSVNRVPFDDPPSITEGKGGKVTDYRINDYSTFMKSARLVPWISNSTETSQDRPSDVPLEKMQSKIERMARHWPLVLSQTIIFNMSASLEPLLSIVLKESITEEQVVQCKQTIYHVIEMERDNAQLPVVSSGGRTKPNKREEQYKAMWTELENFLSLHSTTSDKHKDVLDCLLQCIGKSDMASETKIATDAVFESPESPPPMKKPKTEDTVITSRPAQKGAQSLYDMWWKKIDNVNQQKHVEFYGRLTSEGNVARLYPHLEINTEQLQTQERGGRHSGHTNYHRNSRSSTPSGRSTPTGRSTPSGRLTPNMTGGKLQKTKREKASKNY